MSLGVGGTYPEPLHDPACFAWWVARDWNAGAGTLTDRKASRVATQPTAGKRPTPVTVNGFTWLSFDGTNDDLYYDNAAWAASGALVSVPTTMLLHVQNLNSGGATSCLWSGGSSTDFDNVRRLNWKVTGDLETGWVDNTGVGSTYTHQSGVGLGVDHTIALVDEGPTTASISNDTTQASNIWTVFNTTRTDGQVDPGGGANAVLVTDTAPNTLHGLFGSVSNWVVNGVSAAMFDLWLKQGTLSWLKFVLGGSGSFIYVNLSTGATGTSGGGMTATVIATLGGYRQWRFTCARDTLDTGGLEFRLATADGTDTYAGGTGTIFVGTGATYGPVFRQPGRRTVYLNGVAHTADPRANNLRGDAVDLFTIGAHRVLGSEGSYAIMQFNELAIHTRAFTATDVRVFGAGMRARARYNSIA